MRDDVTSLGLLDEDFLTALPWRARRGRGSADLPSGSGTKGAQSMDGETFDILVKRLTQTRLTRWEALRGVLASVVVGLTGAASATDTTAKRKRKHKGS